jgi:hypothetical protein
VQVAMECTERFEQASTPAAGAAGAGASVQHVPDLAGALPKCVVVSKRVREWLGRSHASIVTDPHRKGIRTCAQAPELPNRGLSGSGPPARFGGQWLPGAARPQWQKVTRNAFDVLNRVPPPAVSRNQNWK